MPAIDATLTDLALSRAGLDRSAHERRDPDLVARLLDRADTRVVEVRGDRLLVETGGPTGLALVTRAPDVGDAALLGVHLGRDPGGTAYVAVIGPEDPVALANLRDGGVPGDGPRWLTLRESGAGLGDRDAGIVTTSVALANWHAAHRHCPRCGHPTEPTQAGWVRRCPADGTEHYPRTDPAVIMSVVDADDRLLLGRGAHWPEGRFSVLAGFVEPGESFEAAVAREVLEEVGIVVDDVRYLGNQPWPFPSSVMIGFAATTRQTDLTLDATEMAEARWVTRAAYRELLRSGQIRTPSGISIAKRIIEHWLGQTVESVAPRATGF
ncbi:NUDIX hydrolase [Intrasporangium oryzae NRRL B-24470]|uniref:NAD(+) diphosphatase n=1 Tax=Intrasporangium oryzae NRRL B-24470 TaxID=1386089 RepID=W9G4R6_9MICO|nr:NAD(+) diphosphatase [Intrasporangium oryzae]EWT00307.1 NUDIX hydrolase [Intrasporangium oryzae NRRL B-24470]